MFNKLITNYYNGNCLDSYNFFGAHIINEHGINGVRFVVYAPNALHIQVVGDFNNWVGKNHEMIKFNDKGIYVLFVPGLKSGMKYKYRIYDSKGNKVDKSDPYAFYSELRPNTNSIIKSLDNFTFDDDNWMKKRTKNFDIPLNIYEVHLGSWKQNNANLIEDRWKTYKEICYELIEYLIDNKYTHVEFLPLSEYPLDKSWGYQISGYFSITSRYGTPEEFMYLINELHKNNIGVIMDFVPVHFVKDKHGLAKFDGTCLYEYDDPIEAESQWGTFNFDFSKPIVRSFIMSAAAFYFDKYHIDGLRIDAVANAIYWKLMNSGSVNKEAVNFFAEMNKLLNNKFNNIMLIAEDSSTYPNVTLEPKDKGLGFDYKWDLGWMNDTLQFFSMPPVLRRQNHNMFTFSMMYYYDERFLLPLSHDEVVHGKKSIIDKMWGSSSQKFAQYKTLFVYMFTHPGKKLNFMGNELAMHREWDERRSVDWFLLANPKNNRFNKFIKCLNQIYSTNSALYEIDFDKKGFEWVNADDIERTVYSYMRISSNQKLVIVINASANYYNCYNLKSKYNFKLIELLNSEDKKFDGCGIINKGIIHSRKKSNKDKYYYKFKLPPFSSIIFKVIE